MNYIKIVYIGGCFNDGDVFAYAPQNELDKKIFESFQNMDILKSDNIKLQNSMKNPEFNCEHYYVGKIDMNDHPKCSVCKLSLPADLNYYTQQLNSDDLNDSDDSDDSDNSDISNKYKNTYYLCHLCYDVTNDINKEQFIVTKIDSDLDNIKDWVHIFTYIKHCEEYVYPMNYYTDYYCNLNPNSQYYKRFAMNYYVEMLGDAFRLINEQTIEEIINKYEK